MTDTIDNIRNDIDLKLEEIAIEIERETMNRAAEIAFTVEVIA